VASHHPGPVTARCVEPLREVVDEVVIGADDRVGEDDLAWYGSVADILVTYPFTGSDQFRPWLARQARGDWLLLLDGDELVSDELARALHTLIADRTKSGYLLPRRWIHLDAGTAIASPPWDRDLQLRLVRNDDRLWFPALMHTGAVVDGPVQRLHCGLYHLDLLLHAAAERLEKVNRYDADEFAHLTAGAATNETFYLPERAGPIELGTVPQVDAARIRVALDPRIPSRRLQRPRPAMVVTRASTEQVLAFVPWAEFGGRDYVARLVPLAPPHNVVAGSPFEIAVRVTNNGGRVWPGAVTRPPHVRLAYHWRRDGRITVREGRRTALPHELGPGQATEAVMVIEPPTEPGHHELVLDLVHEHVRWFALDTVVPVEVTPPPADVLRPVPGSELVDLDAALAMRARLVPPDELARLMTSDDATATAVFLTRWLARVRPSTVLHAGCGPTTVTLGRAMRDLGLSSKVVALASDEAAAAEVEAALDEQDLAQWADVTVLPFEPVDVEGAQLATWDPVGLEEVLAGRSPRLVVLDGAARHDTAAQCAALLAVQNALRRPAAILADEAWRDRSLFSAQRWSRLRGVWVRGIATVGSGWIIGDLTPVGGVLTRCGGDEPAAPVSAFEPERGARVGDRRWEQPGDFRVAVPSQQAGPQGDAQAGREREQRTQEVRLGPHATLPEPLVGDLERVDDVVDVDPHSGRQTGHDLEEQVVHVASRLDHV
jgi:hypothetical protein